MTVLRIRLWATLLAAFSLTFSGCFDASTKPSGSITGATPELVNVSYDASRELWLDLNAAFKEDSAKHAKNVTVTQQHGGSSAQAQKVVDGYEADVVTLGLWSDTNAIAKAGLIQPGWEDEFPNGSLPYYSTIVFVVRKGNPKDIKDWSDLVKEGVEVVTPNPKTSGNGVLSLLSAWGSVTTRGGSEADAKAFLKKLYEHVPVLDSGGRGATITFSQNKIGDVHLTWENEGHYEVDESKGELTLIYPPVSIRAEPRVAIVDAVVDQRGTRDAARQYLEFLYTDAAQHIIAKRHFRPYKPEIMAEHAAEFPKIELFTVKDISAGWEDAQKKFIDAGGVYDELQKK